MDFALVTLWLLDCPHSCCRVIVVTEQQHAAAFSNAVFMLLCLTVYNRMQTCQRHKVPI